MSDDPAGFAASLPQYMVSDPNLGKEDKEYLENALPRYLAFFDSLEPAVQEEVAGLASLAVKARVKPYPGLWDFLQTQKRMQEVHGSEQAAWFEALRGMLKANRGRYFSELVSRTRDFLMEVQKLQAGEAGDGQQETDSLPPNRTGANSAVLRACPPVLVSADESPSCSCPGKGF